ncbi:glycosyl hydrolase family 28-related protein [Paenibacillus sp. GCM10027626]|uniref:glycosyl hydrolase family 28-related protein n=1 Tax=Paenibacillus sp. GCM10027626 TaxID=3273411 RepID=UPI0036288BB5
MKSPKKALTFGVCGVFLLVVAVVAWYWFQPSPASPDVLFKATWDTETGTDANTATTAAPEWGMVKALQHLSHVVGYDGKGEPQAFRAGSGEQGVTAYSGDGYLQVSGQDINPKGNSHAYHRVFEGLSIKIADDTRMTYMALHHAYTASRHMSIDLVFSDNTTLRDSGVTDTKGVRMHPTSRDGVLDEWTKVEVELSPLKGKLITAILVAYDNETPSEGGPYMSFFDDLIITGTDFSVKLGAPRLVSTVFPSADRIVANAVVTDAPFDADTTGAFDASDAIQDAIDAVYKAGGGVVYIPEGTYKVSRTIDIRNHVTLRGDRRDPDKGSGSYGAVIMAYAGKDGTETDPGLFRIWGSAGADSLTVYYPEQSAGKPIPYSYTFQIVGRMLGEDGYMCATVQNVTMLNSYRGIFATAHEMHTIRNVKGTVLYKGMALYDSADVSHVENVRFNASYWASVDESVSSTKPEIRKIQVWTRENGIGMELSGLEWDSFSNIHLSDYRTGIDITSARRSFNGHLFDVHVENSNVALLIGNIPEHLGMVIANSSFRANQGVHSAAVRIVSSNNTMIQFNNTIVGGGAEHAVQLLGQAVANFQNCTFDEWSGEYAIVANQGTLAVEGSAFLPQLTAVKKGIDLQGKVSSAVLLGNSFTGTPNFLLDNSSAGDVQRQDTGYKFEQIDVASYPAQADSPKPVSENFFNVQDYGAAGTPSNAQPIIDDTSVIQNALNAAGEAGGGTVYMPAGIYRVEGHLVVPAGVELRGSEGVPHRAAVYGSSTGTILYAYEGRGTKTSETDQAFITLNGDHAGVRGLSVHYPEQATDEAANIVSYPWTIRGNGSGVYVYDMVLVNPYKGIDFATHRTDGHLISHVGGTMLKEGIRVGNSTDGQVEHVLFNITYWGRAYGLEGTLYENVTMFPVAGTYVGSNLKAYVVTEGARNEYMLNAFVFDFMTAFTFEEDASATVINSAADHRGNAIHVTGTGPSGVTLVNFFSSNYIEGVTDINFNKSNDGQGGAGATGLANSGGTIRVFNWNAKDNYEHVLYSTGGSTIIQGASFPHDTARITGGNVTINGTFFRDSGPQAIVGAGASANLWGNIGGGGAFTAEYANGARGTAAYNIRR